MRKSYIRWRIRRLYRRIIYKIFDWNGEFRAKTNHLIYKPIYYYHWGIDCDMCESSYYDVFYGTSKAFDAMVARYAEGAEGAFTFQIITRDEYEANKDETTHRDRCLEAYENGRGTSIYV